MRTKKVKFSNYRNVPDMEKELNGHNIILLGENTVGKSNFIKAIVASLGGGSFGKNAIRTGENRAEVEIRMADFTDDYQPIPGTEYTFKAEIEKKGEQEEVKLSVMAPNGIIEKRKSVIGSIVGEIELDYNFVELSRTAAGKKKQIEIIKNLLDPETKEFLKVEENKIQTAYNDRTEVGRMLDAARGFLKTAGMTPDDFRKYSKQIDTAKLRSDLEEALKTNQKIIDVSDRIAERILQIPIKEAEIKSLEAKIAGLRNDLIDIATKNSEAKKYLEINKPVEIEVLKKEMDAAEVHNKNHATCSALVKSQMEADKLEEEYGELTALIDSGRQAVSDAIKDMNLPIKGITFDQDNLFYKGKIVDENNMSTAEIMIFEARIKMCQAPNASVLFIHRGESLGWKLLSELQSAANEEGFQIIMEQVERGTDELKVEFMPKYSKN